jgi:hypothetical protein
MLLQIKAKHFKYAKTENPSVSFTQDYLKVFDTVV